jgi:hypothetical protein
LFNNSYLYIYRIKRYGEQGEQGDWIIWLSRFRSNRALMCKIRKWNLLLSQRLRLSIKFVKLDCGHAFEVQQVNIYVRDEMNTNEIKRLVPVMLPCKAPILIYKWYKKEIKGIQINLDIAKSKCLGVEVKNYKLYAELKQDLAKNLEISKVFMSQS